ncbi:MAG: aminotransferase class III-fold pyridoxal phosphate-dependent enzyme [Bacteroidota bacterium]
MQLYPVYSRLDIIPIKGQGSWIWDDQGHKYLDLYGGHAVISIGHNHPTFTAALQDQLSKLPYYSNSVELPVQQELANKLGQLSGLPDYQLFLCNSGAEANENALKLASFQTGKSGVIAFNKAFHGRTSAAVNVTQNLKIQAPINQGFPVFWCSLNDLDGVAQVLKTESIAAVILEGLQGIGGLDSPTVEFLENLSTLCAKHGTLLLLDEIQSGVGRTGDFFAFQQANIRPDLITMAKGLGNGFPVGAVMIHPKFQAFPGQLGSTFGGNPLACIAAKTVLEIIESEQLMQHALYMEQAFKTQLNDLPGLKKIKGRGLMLGLEFDFPVQELRYQLLKQERLFTGSSANPNLLRILPPLNLEATAINYLHQSLLSVLPVASF